MYRNIIRWFSAAAAAASLIGMSGPAALAAPAPVQMTFNAAPEPADQGQALTLSGRVWLGATGNRSRVYFYFRRANTPAWVYTGYADSNDRGYFSTRTTARYSGTWRAMYRGTASRAAITRLDAVAVLHRVPRRLVTYTGTSTSWQGPRIRIPTADFQAVATYRCPVGGYMYLHWNGDSFGFESVSSSTPSGTLTLNGHQGARSGYFDIDTYSDCSWTITVYSGTVRVLA
ncbi:hypothetical protein [Krasilnikovia sp. MM14-A1004]|uniref:hypothetical protein n=1 Tax=Krasilnikovia sp. MM14-A1004 TaxID=3373541 RepID=UPI00399C99CF